MSTLTESADPVGRMYETRDGCPIWTDGHSLIIEPNGPGFFARLTFWRSERVYPSQVAIDGSSKT